MILVTLFKLLALKMALFVAAESDVLSNLPPPLRSPGPKAKLVHSLKGVGTQRYQCVTKHNQLEWVLYGVDAKLYGTSGAESEKVVGNHFMYHENNGLTPVWEIHRVRIFGKKVAYALKPHNLAWLELKASGGSGIKKVYRTNTNGGLPGNPKCNHAKQTLNVHYSAIYSFFK